mgnify:CR=1 FL=1
MKLFMYLILGFIQGFTEPIPVSSSGHLVIFNSILNVEAFKDLNFEIITNFGSFIAIVYFYRKEIISIIKDFFMYIKTKENKYYENFRYALLIIVATIPAGIFGLLLKDTIERITSVKIVGVSLLITAVLILLVSNIKGTKEKKDITFVDALIIGLFQVIALVPGISRSGATIVGGMFRNLKRETAFDFSFLLYIPISVATTILGIKDLFTSNLSAATMVYYLVATIIAGVVTYFATKWFRNVVKEGKLIYFVIYCLIAGTLVLLFL